VRDDKLAERLKDVVRQCHTLAWMAYFGNAGDRQALGMIRNQLDRVIPIIGSTDPEEPRTV